MFVCHVFVPKILQSPQCVPCYFFCGRTPTMKSSLEASLVSLTLRNYSTRTAQATYQLSRNPGSTGSPRPDAVAAGPQPRFVSIPIPIPPCSVVTPSFSARAPRPPPSRQPLHCQPDIAPRPPAGPDNIPRHNPHSDARPSFLRWLSFMLEKAAPTERRSFVHASTRHGGGDKLAACWQRVVGREVRTWVCSTKRCCDLHIAYTWSGPPPPSTGLELHGVHWQRARALFPSQGQGQGIDTSRQR
jgi:hypothetical protein